MAIGAAIAIGAFLTLFDAASEADPYWATGGVRVAAWFTALAFLAVTRPHFSALGGLSRGVLLALAAIGVCSVVADGSHSRFCVSVSAGCNSPESRLRSRGSRCSQGRAARTPRPRR
jgi:hypothetical protein